jgi:hypothetical protein
LRRGNFLPTRGAVGTLTAIGVWARRNSNVAGYSLLALGVVVSVFFLRILPADASATSHEDQKFSKAKSDPKPPAAEVVVPFHVGETLKYEVAWSAFSTAAAVQLNVVERRELTGWNTWHFRASAHTENTVRTLFAIDDQFDSYTDATSLESRQYETYLNEMGKKQDRVFHLLPMGQSAHDNAPHTIVAPGTRDPLGLLYALRRVDWQKTPEFRAPVYDGHDVYEIRAHVEAESEPVEVTAGKYITSRIALRLYQHDKEVSGMNFSAWIAQDASRTPVRMRAELPLGSLNVELISASQQAK